jgi:uncharacterized protein (DUF427 family)
MKSPGPDHPIDIAPTADHVTVRYRGAVVADTRRALELREASYPPVLYVPWADVLPRHYERTDRHTHCPYKGDASYFSLIAGDARAENAAWSYQAPYPAVAQIAGHVAFYAGKVDIERRPA